MAGHNYFNSYLQDLQWVRVDSPVGTHPLGQDPQSGLQEFLHLALHDGDIPVRDKKGHLSIDEQTGIIFVLIPQGKCWIGIQNTDKSGPNYDPFATKYEFAYAQKEMTIKSSFFMSKYEMTQAQWQRSPATQQKPSHFMIGFRAKGSVRNNFAFWRPYLRQIRPGRLSEDLSILSVFEGSRD